MLLHAKIPSRREAKFDFKVKKEEKNTSEKKFLMWNRFTDQA